MSKDEINCDRPSDKTWDRLLSEIGGTQDEVESKGSVDEILIARYLAGNCDDGERQQVEQAARSSPAVRECIDICREALLDAAPEAVTPSGADGSAAGRTRPAPASESGDHRLEMGRCRIAVDSDCGRSLPGGTRHKWNRQLISPN